MRVETLVPTVPTPAPRPTTRQQADIAPRETFTRSGARAEPTLRQILNGTRATDPPVPTRQFADSYGRVTHLALMLSPYVGGEARDQVLGAYKTLFTEMEPDTNFTIVVENDDDRKDVEKVIADNQVANPERIRFIAPDVGDLTVWARDMMVGLYTPEDDSHTALLHQTTLHYWHDNDAKVPGIITEQNPSILLDTEPRLVTDGGDVQSNTKESFVGYYSIAATEKQIGDRMQQDPALKKSLIQYYQQHFGKQVVDQRGPIQYPFRLIPRDTHDRHEVPFRLENDPNFRVAAPGPGKVTLQQATEDLAVSLFQEHFGKPVQVMGRDNPDTPDTEEPATDHMDMGMTPIDDETFLVGDPGLARKLIDSMTPEERAQAEAALSRAQGRPVHLGAGRNRDNQGDFDEYARIHEAKGYKVLRVPHSEPGDGTNGAYISYNNCLMERFEKDGKELRRVFLPVYGIPKLDDYAIDVWKSQGFEVHPMPLDALSASWGALRCISNWLDRTPRG